MIKKLLPVVLLLLLGCHQNSSNLVESTGTLEATQIDIRAEVGGKILKLYFDDGDRVKPGAVFAEIDKEKLEYQLQETQAHLRELEAQLAQLQTGFRVEEVKKAQDFFQESKIQMEEAKRDYNRVFKLFQEKVASTDQKDTAETAYKSALKRYEMAKNDYMIYKEGYRKEDIARAQAAKESGEAAIRLIQRSIKDATVVIPAKGIMQVRYVELGELVTPGSILATVTDLQDMWIMAYISEKNLGKIKLGQSAQVFVDSFPDKPFPGKVIYISTEAEFTPKNIQTKEERVKLVYAVKVQIDNTKETLKVGMPADVVINAQESEA
jgi:HlyD family secretion protein